MGEKPQLVRRGRGKPRKTQEIIGSMVIAHSPEMAGEALFMSSDLLADPIEDQGVAAKLERISHVIGLRLGNAISEAQNAADSEDDDEGGLSGLTGVRQTLRPWLEKKSPVNAFSDAERAKHANGRVVDTLLRHLVEHIVIDHELGEIVADARRRAVEELVDIPLAMVDFVNRLMASGVRARDVRDMPKQRLAEVVSVIRGTSIDDAIDAVPENLPRSSWPDPSDGSPTGSDPVDGDRLGTGSEGLIDKGLKGEELPPEEPAIATVEPVSNDASAAIFDAGSKTDPDAEDAATRNGFGDEVATPEKGVEQPTDASAKRDDSDVEEAGDSESRGADITGSIASQDLFAVAPSVASEAELSDGMAEPSADETGGVIEADVSPPIAEETSANGSEDVSAEPAVHGAGGGLWDVIDVSRTGYAIEEHVIGSDEDLVALRMQLPEDRSMRAMAMPKSLEETLATGAQDEGDSILAQRFVGRFCSRTGKVLTEEERRLWLFLLFEIRTSEERQLGRAGFFDGVRLPGPKGTTRVRRLVAMDRDRLGDAADAGTLSGPAMHRK